jgi:hypothetical protein
MSDEGKHALIPSNELRPLAGAWFWSALPINQVKTTSERQADR